MMRTTSRNRKMLRLNGRGRNFYWEMKVRMGSGGYRGSKCLITGSRKTRKGCAVTFEGICPFYTKDRWANAFMGRLKGYQKITYKKNQKYK